MHIEKTFLYDAVAGCWAVERKNFTEEKLYEPLLKNTVYIYVHMCVLKVNQNNRKIQGDLLAKMASPKTHNSNSS